MHSFDLASLILLSLWAGGGGGGGGHITTRIAVVRTHLNFYIPASSCSLVISELAAIGL